jgi:hypothetical protein
VAGEKGDLASDFRDLLRAFVDHEVRFLVVGAYALAIHGHPRATGDLDVWVDPDAENARRAHTALAAFGTPLHELREEDLATPGTVFQIGLPPLRIDVLTRLTGLDFGPAWTRRVEADFEGVRVPVIGRADFLHNKRALGRTRDLADAERLEAPESTQKRG